jgi:glycosyltransferase involved in cell wall biosynthesis
MLQGNAINDTYFFSVCVETFNRASTIAEVIRNIIGQSCQDFELIVVDNGSTDETFDLILEILINFSPERLTIIRDSFTENEMVRWNRPLKLARGRHIAICEGDDYFSLNHLALAKAAIEKFPANNFHMYTTELESFTSISEEQIIDLPSSSMQRNLGMFRWCPAPSQVIFSREIRGVPFLFDLKAQYAGEYSLYEAALSTDGILIRNHLDTVIRGYRYYPRDYTHIVDAVQFYKKHKKSNSMDSYSRTVARSYLARTSLYFFVQQAVHKRLDSLLLWTFFRFASPLETIVYMKTIRGAFSFSTRMKNSK